MPPKQLSRGKNADQPNTALAADVSFGDETGERSSLKLEDMTRLGREQRGRAAEILEDMAERLRMPEDHDNPSGKSKTTALAITKGSKGDITTIPALYSPERPSIALREKLNRMGRQSEALMSFFGEEHEILDRKDRMIMIDGSHRDIASWEEVERAVYANPKLQRAINELVPDPETGTPLLVPDFAGARVAMLLNAAALMGKKVISPTDKKNEPLGDSEVKADYSELFSLQIITNGEHLNLPYFDKSGYSDESIFLYGEISKFANFDKRKRLKNGELGRSKVGWTFIDATPHETSKRKNIFKFAELHKDSAQITGVDIENIIALFLNKGGCPFQEWVLSNSSIWQKHSVCSGYNVKPIACWGDSDSLTMKFFEKNTIFILGSPRQVRVIVD